MVASPPVRRATSDKKWRAQVLLHAASLVAGALVLGGGIASVVALLGEMPRPSVGVVAVLAGATAAGFLPQLLPSSRWQVPRSWARLGEARYVTAFGFVLGLGVFTAIPSSGFYVVIAWGLSTDWAHALLALVAFAFARATPLLVAAAVGRRGVNAPTFAWTARRIAMRLHPLEVPLLVVVAAVFLL